MRMLLEYANKLLAGGHVFGNAMISCHDWLLVVEDDRGHYYGTELDSNLNFKVDAEGYVVFRSVVPIVDDTTRFTL